tara:strand:- start:14 stop:376 length:363 start_codon:yes stop_codon:yes gene_type:complete
MTKWAESRRTIDFTADEISVRHHLNRINKLMENIGRELGALRKDVFEVETAYRSMHDVRMESGVDVDIVDQWKSCQCYECVHGRTGTIPLDWKPVKRVVADPDGVMTDDEYFSRTNKETP